MKHKTPKLRLKLNDILLDDRFFNFAEIAQHVGCNQTWIYNQLKKNDTPTFKYKKRKYEILGA